MGAPDVFFSDFMARVRASVFQGRTLDRVPEWVEKNTFLRGKAFSFKDHEFQLQILRDPAREINVRKPSQVGVSEMTVRMTLAIARILDGSTIIYTLPTALAGKDFMKTRFDPVIKSSPDLSAAISAAADNTEMKQLGDSFIYVKGTIGTKAAITIPADGVFHDEQDFSDQEVLSQYQSRLTHSNYKLKRKFSTPTVEGYGISAEMQISRRHFNHAKCDKCSHWFLPDYFQHVKIPDYLGDLREITKENIHELQYREAHMECPRCGGKPSLQPEWRQWVCENPDQNFEAAGYQIQPFDAPNVIALGDLILSSTKYKRYIDFINFGLGLPAEDKETSLYANEVEECFHEGEISGYFSHVMGIDVGMVCHVMVAGVDGLGQIAIVHTEKVPASMLKKRKAELQKEFRVRVTVIDSQPYTETVLDMQQSDINLYGAVYVHSKDLATYRLKKIDEEADEGLQELRQVNVNRNKAFDDLVRTIRAGQWIMRADNNRADIVQHFTDMKRVRQLDADGEDNYAWVKSAKGDDHFFHTALYTHIAAQIKGVGTVLIGPPGLVFKFKLKG